MDAMDVLGALLGRKSSGGSAGGNILKDILGGQAPSAPTPQPRRAPEPRRAPQPQRTNRPRTIGDAAQSLEDLLNVSHEEHTQRRQTPAPNSAPQRVPQPTPQRAPTPSSRKPLPPREALNEQSVVLVRAMIGAAKADGQITQDEQQQIINQLGHVDESTIEFLRQEFSRPIDVKELAWSVPLGMEEQAYTISLIAIDLDENKEAQYLGDLAHGLRLQPSVCNAIHRKYGAPEIFHE